MLRGAQRMLRLPRRAVLRPYVSLINASVLLMAALFTPAASSAQLMINKGTTVSTKLNSIVWVGGSYQNAAGTIDDSGTVWITQDFTNNTGAIAGGSGWYNIAGNYTNDATWLQKTGTVNLNGTSNQNVGGAVTTTFYDLQFTNGGSKTLTHKEIVDSNCYFTNGICYTTQTNVLNFTTKGNWVNNSGLPTGPAISYVDGPCEKDMNTTNEFQFPVGKQTRGNTCSITPSNATPTTFRTEYFNFKYVNTTSVLSPLVSVSKIHYWHGDIVTPTTGGANAMIKLYWIPGDYTLAQYISTPSSLVVARWNIALQAWETAGQNAIRTSPPATYQSGWVQSLPVLASKYGTASTNQPFTIASTTADNTLPVEMGPFTVRQVENHVVLDWKTYAEIQNLGFEIERRRVGGEPAIVHTFETDTALIAKSPWGASYSVVDDGLTTGDYIYELFQIDQNGTRTRVGSRQIAFSEIAVPNRLAIACYPNPAFDKAHLSILMPRTAEVKALLLDITGKIVMTIANEVHPLGENVVEVPVSELPSGVYQLVAESQGERVSQKILVQH